MEELRTLLNKYLEELNKAEKMRATCIAAGNNESKECWETKINYYSTFVYDLANALHEMTIPETVEEDYFGYHIAYFKTIVF